MRTWIACGLVMGAAAALAAQNTRQDPARQFVLDRAKSLELNTPYVPPPGDPLVHYTSGFAKVMCSAVFITGLDPDFAQEHVGYFTGPYDARSKVSKPVIDRASKAVHITMPDGVTRTARYLGSQGCVTLPIGQKDVFYTPVAVKSALPDPATQDWPMGDRLPATPLPSELDQAKLKQVADIAFDPEAFTAAFVVTWKGRIIAERYGPNITPRTPLESWSMGKSLSATLMGVLLKRGDYDLWQPAPIPEWQSPGDPRAKIRIADILRMSSGLRIKAPQDPDFDPKGTYPDHLYLYTATIDSFKYAATRPPRMATKHGRTLSEHRPGAHQLPDEAGTRQAQGAVSRVPAESALRQDRHSQHGARDRSVWELPHAGLRARRRPRLGAARQLVPAGRRVERRADPARRLRHVRADAGPGVGGRQAAHLRRVLLVERRRDVPGPQGRVLHERRRRSDDADCAVARPRHRPARSLQGRRPRGPSAAQGALRS